MWSALSAKGRLAVVIALTVLAITGLQTMMPLFGVMFKVSTAFKVISGTIFFVDVVFVTVFNALWKKIWKRWPKLGEWIFPDISGDWKGEIRWTDQNGNNGTKSIALHISQNWLRFKVALSTDEAASESVYAWVCKDTDLGRVALSYVYGHTPSATSQQNNPAHEGTAHIFFKMGEPTEASGRYYTARRTVGDIAIYRS